MRTPGERHSCHRLWLRPLLGLFKSGQAPRVMTCHRNPQMQDTPQVCFRASSTRNRAGGSYMCRCEGVPVSLSES